MNNGEFYKPTETTEKFEKRQITRREAIKRMLLIFTPIGTFNPKSLTQAYPAILKKPEKEILKDFDIRDYKKEILEFFNLKLSLAQPHNKINSNILNLDKSGFILDFPKELKKVSTTKDKLLETVKFLASQSREEIRYEKEYFDFMTTEESLKQNKKYQILSKLSNLRYYLNGKYNQEFIIDWKKLFPNSAIPSDEQFEEIVNQFYVKYFQRTNWLIETYPYQGVESWHNQASCNLYASSFIACLGLQEFLSHRVDERNNPIIYIKNDKTGEIEFFIKENGKLQKPKGKIRELNALDQHNWLINNGEKYGWEDVTYMTYQNKIKILENNYIFYGSTEGHNWIVIGLNINGKIIPTLTQATDQHFLRLFLPEQYITKDWEIYNKYPEILYTSYAQSYKLMPDKILDETAKIYAIKIN